MHACMVVQRELKHLPNVEACFHCPQAFLSLDFHCKMDVSELKRRSGIEKSNGCMQACAA